MAKVSRRRLAKAVVTELLAGKPKSRVIHSLAAYMVEHKMVNQTEMLVGDITNEYARQTGQLTVEVASTHQLSDAIRKQLTEFFAKETGAKKVVLHESRDQQLIGGLVARTPDAELDLSVRRKLTKLRA